METELLRFLRQYEAWIYALSGVVAAFYLRRLLIAWRDWRITPFGLERAIAQRKLSSALTMLVLSALLVVGEFLVVSFVAPATPGLGVVPTPTLALITTPTATLAVAAQSTPTPSETGGTEIPLTEGCTQGQVEWAFPTAGVTISGTVELKGTVNVPNLGFYKYEYAVPGTDAWVTIAAGNKPLVGGSIGFWNTSQLTPGDYLLRLVVADNLNQFFPACVVKVRVGGT